MPCSSGARRDRRAPDAHVPAPVSLRAIGVDPSKRPMSKHQWAHDLSRAISTRDFLASLATAGAGVAVAGLSACGGSTGNDGGIVAPPATGNITGLVSTLAGVPQPGLGTLI